MPTEFILTQNKNYKRLQAGEGAEGGKKEGPWPRSEREGARGEDAVGPDVRAPWLEVSSHRARDGVDARAPAGDRAGQRAAHDIAGKLGRRQEGISIRIVL